MASFGGCLRVEIEWLKALAADHFTEISAFSPSTVVELERIVANFGAGTSS